jgi:hypothetical protein
MIKVIGRLSQNKTSNNRPRVVIDYTGTQYQPDTLEIA